MFGAIVVPLDGSVESERALDIAVPMAKHLKVPLRAVSYVDRHYVAQTELDVRASLGARDLGDLDVRITIEEPTGRIADHLLDLVGEVDGPDASDALLVLSTRGRGRSELFAGSVANEVVRKSGRPVLLVGPSCRVEAFDPTRSVVVASDDSGTSEGILPAAIAWADAFSAPMMLLSVLDPAAASLAEQSHGDLSETAGLHRLADRLRAKTSASVEYDVLHFWHPAPAIVERAAPENVSVIAMATHGATGLARLTAGSTTSAVTRTAEVPILTIRPKNLDT